MSGIYDGQDANSSFINRKGKTCSMKGCPSTRQRFPSMSFFRIPKEDVRAKEWLIVCQRPDLLKRLEDGDININNFYMCEAHFENQILDYATRKILVRNAQPTALDDSKYTHLPRDHKHVIQDFEHVDLDEEDDEYADVDEEYLKGLTPQVIITKTEPIFDNDDPDNSISFPDGGYNDYYADDLTSRQSQLFWTPEATRLLIKLRGARDADFEQRGAKKRELWIEITNQMRDHGYNIAADRVSKKWHNLLITYKNQSKKHGQISWEFFDDVKAVYNDDNVRDNFDSDNDSYLTPLRLDHLEQNGVDLQPAKRKRRGLDDNFDGNSRRKSRPYHESEPEAEVSNHSEAHSVTLLKRLRQNMATDDVPPPSAATSSAPSDDKWWRDYLERKMDLEKEKLRRDDERHRDVMNFRKMSIMVQEKSEKMKVEAMNNLTSAIAKLIEDRFS